MFGTDEFGNTRLLALSFMLLFALLSLGTITTSQTMWGTADSPVVQVRH